MSELDKYLMRQIVLDAEFNAYTVFAGDEILTPKRLEGLGKINIFVGANNSGKSRLIRSLARAKKIAFEPFENVRPLGLPIREIGKLGKLITERVKSPHYSAHEIVSILGVREMLGEFEKLNFEGLITEFKSVNSQLTRGADLLSRMELESVKRAQQQGWNSFGADIGNAKAAIDLAIGFERDAHGIQRVYVPTLRTLRHLGNEHVLKSITSKDYQIDQPIIFTGESLYEDVELLLRGNLEDREALRNFENWIAETFFERRAVAIIPKKNHSTLTIKIGDEQEKPIHELGDGIQSLLILTFPLFRMQDKHVLAFIEEPELFLHPWLQRAFLETLSTRFPKHQYFLTTHSNHFLDLTLDLPDVSVYTLEKEFDQSQVVKERPAKFNVRQVSRDDRKPLELLGVRNSSVFLSNCTIWVEGITDRRYIAHWLKIYQERDLQEAPKPRIFKEDLHYSFVEYGGGNITHFSFLDDSDEMDLAEKGINVDRLCAKLFLITDADGDKKKDRKTMLAKRLGDRYYCLPGREIENLIKPEVLQKVLAAYGEESPPLFTHKSYLAAQLAKIIDDKLGGKRKRKVSYGDEYGVLKGKVAFCEKAVSETHGWNDVSEESKDLIARVYQFIASMNPK